MPSGPNAEWQFLLHRADSISSWVMGSFRKEFVMSLTTGVLQDGSTGDSLQSWEEESESPVGLSRFLKWFFHTLITDWVSLTRLPFGLRILLGRPFFLLLVCKPKSCINFQNSLGFCLSVLINLSCWALWNARLALETSRSNCFCAARIIRLQLYITLFRLPFSAGLSSDFSKLCKTRIPPRFMFLSRWG